MTILLPAIPFVLIAFLMLGLGVAQLPDLLKEEREKRRPLHGCDCGSCEINCRCL